MNNVLSGTHLLSHHLRCLHLYQLCQVFQLYFVVSITQQKAAKSSWNVVIRWMGVLWECRHLRRRESSIKGLWMTTPQQCEHTQLRWWHRQTWEMILLCSPSWDWSAENEGSLMNSPSFSEPSTALLSSAGFWLGRGNAIFITPILKSPSGLFIQPKHENKTVAEVLGEAAGEGHSPALIDCAC